MMNLEAKEGDKVVRATFAGGRPWQSEEMSKTFTLGEIYTVNRVTCEGWSATVSLKEFPGKGWNTVFFEDA